MSNCMGAILIISVSSSSALGPQRSKTSIAIGQEMHPRDLAVFLYFLSFFPFFTAANAAVVLLPEMLLCAQGCVIVMSNNNFLPS